MPVNSFRNIGIRRDQNLGDVDNSKESLTNLLNNFVTPASGLSFTADDLISGIENIRTLPITSTDIASIAGIAVDNTYFDPTANEGAGAAITETAKPLISLKNQLDKIKIETGNISYFAGNTTGITGKFYNSNQINNSSSIINGQTVFTGDPVFEEVFWDDGYFEFLNKLDTALIDEAGGIQWEGWYMPNVSGTWVFSIKTSGFCTIEIDNQPMVLFNNYVRSVGFTGTETDKQYSVSPVDLRKVMIGDEIIAVGGTVVNRVVDINFESNTVTMSNTLSLANSVTTTISLSAVNYIGKKLLEKNFTVTGHVEYVPKPIRINLWWYKDFSVLSRKLFEVKGSPVLQNFPTFEYFQTYSQLPDYSTPANFPLFKQFFDNKLSLGGGTVGTENDKQKVITTGTINSSFSIPNNTAGLSTTINDVKIETGTNLIKFGLVLDTANVEYGNYILSSDFPKYTAIQSITSGQGITVSQNATDDQNTSITVLNHKGVVDYFEIGGSGTTVTLSGTDNVTKLVEGMLLVTSTGRFEIVKLLSNTSFEVSAGGFGTGLSFVYSDSGLQNYVTYTVVSSTTNSITLDTTFGIQPGYYVKSYGKAGTDTLTEVASINNNTINLNKNLSFTLLAGDKIIVERANVNTAPPFEATETGLTTALTVSNAPGGTGDIGNRNIVLDNASGVLQALDLEIDAGSDGIAIEITSLPSTYNRTVELIIKGTTFKILASNS